MKKLMFILLGIMTLPAYGSISSKNYADKSFEPFATALSSKVNNSGYTTDTEQALYTDDQGNVTIGQLQNGMFGQNSVTNSKISGGIEITKLDLGTLPTSGKHILIWNAATGKYVFEPFTESAGLQCDTEARGCGYSLHGYLCEKWPEYDIGFAQCVNPRFIGEDYGYINDSRIEYLDPDYYTKNANKYGLTADYTWAAEFFYGTIKGIASCNNSRPEYNGDLVWSEDRSYDWSRSGDTFNQNSEGRYCWCKITSPSASGWVFNTDYGADGCKEMCAASCGLSFSSAYESSFRSAMLSTVGQ